MSDVALLLPGWGTSPVRFRTVQQHLEERGIETHVHAVQPDAMIDRLAERFLDQVRSHMGEGRRLHLVGHSLGGLVVAWAATDDRAPALASVTTINTPWRGTWLAWTGTGELAAQLRYRSRAVTVAQARLHDHLTEPHGPRWLLLGAALDLGTPPTTSLRPRAEGNRLKRRLVGAAGHSTSLLTDRVASQVTDFVTAG